MKLLTSLHSLTSIALASAMLASSLAGQVLTPINITLGTAQVKTVVDCSTGVTVTVPAKPQDTNSVVLGKNISQPVNTTLGAFVTDVDKMASDGSDLWAIGGNPGMLLRLDRTGRSVLERIAPSTAGVSAYALDGNDIIWLGLTDGNVLKYSRLTRQVLQKISWMGAPTTSVQDMTFLGSSLVVLRSYPLWVPTTQASLPPFDGTALTSAIRYWMAFDGKQARNLLAGDVAFLDRTTGKIQGLTSIYRVSFQLAYPGASGYIAVNYGDVTNVNPDGSSVLVTQSSGTTFRFTLVNGVVGVSDGMTLNEGTVKDTKYVDGVLWMISEDTGTLTRVDASKKEVLGRYPTLPGASKLVHDGRRVWVSAKDRLLQFNAFDGTKLGELAFGVSASAIAFDGVNVFAADKVTNTIKSY